MASDYDKTTAIFRGFDTLAYRNLLYFQSELAELEAELKDLDRKDAITGDWDIKRCAKNWKDFQKLSKNDDRKRLTRKIRTIMRDYRMRLFRGPEPDKPDERPTYLLTGKALINESTLAEAQTPTKRVWQAFNQRYYKKRVPSEENSTLGGASAWLYKDFRDLITI